MPDRPHPFLELTRARVVEFLREPEAVFWVFVFPVLLALALGIAFRSRPAEVARAAVVPGSEAARETAERLGRAPGVAVRILDLAGAEEALRKGRVDVVLEVSGAPPPAASVTYRFDPTRPEGRAARLAVDDALQRAAGRADAVPTVERPATEAGSRYIDFLIPGLVGLNLMGSGMWGIGFSVVVARTRKLLKRFAATPMRRSHYLLSFALSRLVFLALEAPVRQDREVGREDDGGGTRVVEDGPVHALRLFQVQLGPFPLRDVPGNGLHPQKIARSVQYHLPVRQHRHRRAVLSPEQHLEVGDRSGLFKPGSPSDPNETLAEIAEDMADTLGETGTATPVEAEGFMAQAKSMLGSIDPGAEN